VNFANELNIDNADSCVTIMST